MKLFCKEQRIIPSARTYIENRQQKTGKGMVINMRKRKEEFTIEMIPEYSRRKLLGYAESFRDLAELFEEEEREGWEEKREKENAAASEEEKETASEEEKRTASEEKESVSETEKAAAWEEWDRQEYLWQKKLCENRGLLAEHLKEMAYIMTDVAQETCRYHPIGERTYKRVAHYLKEAGIFLKDFLMLKNEDGHLEINLMMKARMQQNIVMEDVANLISAAMDVRIRTARNEPVFMEREWRSYRFLEEPAFHILTGFAKAVKESEKISGDNYSFCEIEQGKMAVILSDGMGSGEKACEESEKVIEMMERLLEAGFRKEAAIQIINGALAAGGQEQNMSTLDICELNLYTGACDFIKVGAACTYIKREHLVDRLSARNLPLGVFRQIEPETIHRQLQDGDYIIMLSDGVTGALSQGIGEEILPEIIGKTFSTNPGEIANRILRNCLRQSRGRIRDDMTVLVIGMWKYA